MTSPDDRLIQRERLAAITLRGANLRADIAEQVTAAPIDLGTDQVTELSLIVEDPDLRLLRTGLFALGTPVDYGDLRLLISALAVDGGKAGTGGLTVECRPVLVDRMKRRRGPLVLRNVSPSTFVETEAKAAGARGTVIQPSATRKQVARDVPKAGDEPGSGEAPSSWTTCQRLATELGYLFYEAAGFVYFGRPSWLLSRLPRTSVTWGRAAIDEPHLSAIKVPSVRRTRDSGTVATAGVELDYTRAAEARPGRALSLLGVPGFDGRYLITGASFDLAGTGPVTLDASTPIDPKPAPPEDRDKDGILDGDDPDVTDAPDDEVEDSASVATGGDPRAAGGKATKSSLDFVRIAQSQAGDRYVFAAEARPGDADPDAFDCSELVEWALARVGVRFVDGSVNQINRCKAVPVDEGIRTRGALLFRPGSPNHIAISLGDGRTIEARGRKYGVGNFDARGRFTRAGLVPGLRY